MGSRQRYKSTRLWGKFLICGLSEASPTKHEGTVQSSSLQICLTYQKHLDDCVEHLNTSSSKFFFSIYRQTAVVLATLVAFATCDHLARNAEGGEVHVVETVPTVVGEDGHVTQVVDNGQQLQLEQRHYPGLYLNFFS